MTDEIPVWRQFFDAWERQMMAPTEDMVNTAEFSGTMISAMQQWQSLSVTAKESLAKLLHTANMPAYTDMTKLHRQLGSLTAKVDTLGVQIETLTELLEDVRRQVQNLTTQAPSQ